MPEDGPPKKIDLLFLIANAPVKTAAFPEAGSESYVGLAEAMELATNELSEYFPAFFVEEEELPKQSKPKQKHTKSTPNLQKYSINACIKSVGAICFIHSALKSVSYVIHLVDWVCI